MASWEHKVAYVDFRGRISSEGSEFIRQAGEHRTSFRPALPGRAWPGGLGGGCGAAPDPIGDELLRFQAARQGREEKFPPAGRTQVGGPRTASGEPAHAASPVASVRGAVAGSYPIWGGYGAYEYLNWAAKFTADALLGRVAGTLTGINSASSA